MADKAIFLDRDNTLIEDPGYINNHDQVKLLDGAAEALIELAGMGYKLIVVSNQSAVARGIVSEQVLDEIHNRLKQLLAENGAYLDGIYYCPYHPDGVVQKYRKESNQRKPNPGMLLTAADEMNIDLGQSWTIGDSGRDVEAGFRAGCKTILIERPAHHKQYEPGEPNPDYQAVNIKEAVNIIKKHNRSPGGAAAEAQPTPIEKPALQTTEETQQPKSEDTEAIAAEGQISGNRSEELLSGILRQLKSMYRADMFGEFSIMRLMAGVVQVIVLFCLLLSIWFLMSPTRQDNSVFISLGFAMVLQVMSLTFYIMQGRK
jgi:D,D-heptose 1,7-bisphosphate phosphatase